jgi:hypothetical protein
MNLYLITYADCRPGQEDTAEDYRWGVGANGGSAPLVVRAWTGGDAIERVVARIEERAGADWLRRLLEDGYFSAYVCEELSND